MKKSKVNKRAVRILLECFLVLINFFQIVLLIPLDNEETLLTTPKIKRAVIQLLIFGMNKQVIGIMKSNNMNFLSSNETMALCRKLTRVLRKTGLFRNKKRIAVVLILLMMLYFHSYIPELVFNLTKLHNSLTAFSFADFSWRVR